MPPRGKKAGTAATKKDSSKAQIPEVQQLPAPDPPKVDVPISAIISYIESHLGDYESIKGLKSLILNSSLTDSVISTIIEKIFNSIKPSASLYPWAKSCIQSIFHDTLDPKSRTKDAFFFPNTESEKKLINYIKKAKKSLIVAVFTLTNDDLAMEVRHAKARGVDVRIISDDDLLKMLGSDVRNMFQEGIQVRVDLDPRAQMHNKFCVIDDYLLVTGSFNWTKQAVNMNQENIVVLDEPYLSSLYTQEFNHMWTDFEPSVKKYFGGPVDINHLAPPPEEKPHKKRKLSSASESVQPDEPVIERTAPELISFLESNAGDCSTLASFSSQLLTFTHSENSLSSMLETVFSLVKANPANMNWGKSCIQSIFHDTLDPKTRIKDAFFFPNAESEIKLIGYLKRAKKSIIVAVFTLTNDDLAAEIRAANKRGVSIRVISDDDLMSMIGSDIRDMYDEGIEVRVDLDPRAQMHNKFCVIDDYLLITGSFNWTKQAVNKNQENLVVIDDPFLAKKYTEDFDKMWKDFEPSIYRYFGGPRVKIEPIKTENEAKLIENQTKPAENETKQFEVENQSRQVEPENEAKQTGTEVQVAPAEPSTI